MNSKSEAGEEKGGVGGSEGHTQEPIGSEKIRNNSEIEKKSDKKPDQMAEWRDSKGRFVPGNPSIGSGRPKGSPDGIVLLRRLIARHAEEMSAEGAELDDLIDKLRRDPEGVKWILKNLFDPLLRARESQTNVEGGSIQVIIQPDSARAILDDPKPDVATLIGRRYPPEVTSDDPSIPAQTNDPDDS